MFRTVSVVAALSVGLWGASARAQGTPGGGDDTGLIPPAKSATAKCEAGAAKAADKLFACIIKCHASRASGKLADDTAEDSCEKTLAGKSCAAKFTASIAKLSGCPACINGTTMANLAGMTESVLDGNNSTVYCDTSSGTPFGGDDTGDVPPPKSASAKCEAGAAEAEGKLIACIDKCHASRASGKLADDTAEDSCEKTLAGKSCAAKFTASIAKLSGCPACINGTTMANLAGMTESVLDQNNSTIYCGGCDTEPAAFAGITAQHNSTRANATPTPNPRLANLCWNDVVAGHAQAWAGNCSFSHDPRLGTLGEGQNIYAAAVSSGFPTTAAQDAEPAWAAEAANYDYATNTCALGQVCGHYTQIVWRSTAFLGCGIQNCTTNSPFVGFPNPDWTFVVCNYEPPGNFVGQRPY
jgi:hypothetical protein